MCLITSYGLSRNKSVFWRKEGDLRKGTRVESWGRMGFTDGKVRKEYFKEGDRARAMKGATWDKES